MHTALWVFIAAAIGLMLFSTLQEDLPNELSFLKMPENAVVVTPGGGATGPAVRTSLHQGWEVQQTGNTLSASRAFRGVLEVNGQVYDTPQLGVLCHEDKLSVRIDSRMATTGMAKTPVALGTAEQDWDKGAAGMNVLAPNPSQVLALLLKAQEPVGVTLSYRELGKQTAYVDTTGLQDIAAAMRPGCRP